MLRTLTLSIALLLGPACAQAQWSPPNGGPARALAELQALELSPTQKSQLRQIAFDAYGQQQGFKAEQQELIASASAELDSGSADLRGLVAAQQILTDARISALRSHRDALLDFYDTLSPSQQQSAQAWLLARLERLESAQAAAANFRLLLGD